MEVAQQRARLHPVLWVAAVAVTLFSLTGIGAILGWIPSVGSTPKESAPLAAAQPAPAVGQPEPPVAPATGPTESSAPAARAPAPAAAKPAQAKAAKPHPEERVVKASTRQEPFDKAAQEQPVVVAQAKPAAEPAPVCLDCGIVESVREIKQKGEGSGLGAVAGGVVGGLLGNQIGKGRGNTVATVAGAVGGAVAGHQVEKHVKSTVAYEATVRMDDGSVRTLGVDSPSAWRSGDAVRVVEGRLIAR